MFTSSPSVMEAQPSRRRYATARRKLGMSRTRGVGLVDVLIAVVIVGGGLLAMSKLQGAFAASGSVAKQQSEAGFIAQKVIEDLRAKRWSDLAVGSFDLPQHSGKSAVYSVNYTVADSVSGGPKFKTVVANVTWVDSVNQGQKSTLTARFQESGASGTARLLGMSAGGTGCSSTSSSGSSSSSGGSGSSSSSSDSACTGSVASGSSSASESSSSSASSSSKSKGNGKG